MAMSKHRHILFLYAAVLLLFWACASDGRPENLLSQERMVPIIKDMEISYAGVDQMVKDPKERHAKYQELNGLVFKKHNVDQAQFYTSYKWYESKPMLLDTIFKQVISLLNEDLKAMPKGGKPQPGGMVPDMN